MAFAAYLDAVQKIYIAFYQRPADPAGLRYWAQRMDTAGGDQAAVIDAFATSPEAVALYGPIDANTIGTVVDAIYLALYNRAPDADGKKFYVDGFNAGTFTPGTIALNILNGASNDDAVAIANKLVVANQFTQQVDGRALTDPDFGIGSSSSFNVTYSGDADAVAARDILKAVTSSPATVLNAGEVTEVLKQKIADPTDPIQGESGGKTFTLTENVDAGAAFTGGAGNDLFIATDKLVGNASVQTWTAADQIDGGAGTNTFQVTSGVNAIANPAGATVKNIQIMKVVAANVGVNLNTTDFGLTSLTVNSSGDGSVGTVSKNTFDVTAAATTDITWTAVEQGDTQVAIVGGNNVTVTATKVATSALPPATDGVSVTDAAGDVVISSTGAAYVADTNANLGDIAVDGGKTISVTQVATSDASKAAKDTDAGTVTQGDVTIIAGDDTTSITVKQDADVNARDYSAGKTAVLGQATVTFSALDAGASVAVAGLTFKAGDESLSAEEVAAAFANLSADAILPIGGASGDTQGSANHKKGVFTGSINGYTTGAASGDKVVFTADVAANASANDVAAALTATITGGATAVGKTAGVEGDDAATGRMGITTGQVAITGSASLETVTVDGYGYNLLGVAADGITGTTNTALATLNLANGTDFDVESAATTLALNANNVQGTVDIQSGTTTLNAEVKGNTGAAATKLDSVTVKTLSITGDGRVSGDAGLVAVETIDTTGFTGTANFKINGEQTAYTGGAGVDYVTVTATSGSKIVSQALGAGNDTLNLGDLTGGNILALATGVVFDGGADTDTVILSAAAAEAVSLTKTDATTFLAHITNFENVQIDALGADQTVNLGNLGYSTATVLGGAHTLTLRDAVDGTAVTLRDDDIGGIEVRVKGATSTKLAAGVSLEIADTGDIDAGTFTANNVDTITLVATDTNVTATNPVNADHEVELAADQATSVVVNGNADSLHLVLDASTKALTEIDATDFAGGLTVNLGNGTDLDEPNPNAAIAGQAVTVYGGKGDDTLLASNDEADELFGGAGDDILIAGANSSVLQGGAGNDLYVVNTVGNIANTTAGTGTQATLTLSENGILALISSGDKLTFTFDGDDYTLTFVGTIAGADDLTAALAGATAVADGAPLGADKVTAKSASADKIVLQSSNGKPLAGGEFINDPGGSATNYRFAGSTPYDASTETITEITFSTILGFGTGADLLQLVSDVVGGTGLEAVTAFDKVQTGISQADGKLMANITAAIVAADKGTAAWFSYQGSSYVVIDNDDTDVFEDGVGEIFSNGKDVVIKLAGVDLTNASFNGEFGTIAL